MKRIIATLSIVILTITVEAQIDLEHTYTSNYQGISWFISNSRGIMYFTYDTISNQVKFFTEDYAVYKNVTIPRPVGSTMTVYLASEQLFNSNNLIEFICTFWKGSSSRIELFDENASIIKDFGTYNYMAYPYLVTKGSLNKLVIKGLTKNPSFQYVDEVYSLPGSIPTSTAKLKSLNSQVAFPNPASNNIVLPYTLKEGQYAVMRIYNSNGQLIEQKQIGSTFNSILLNVESYQSGLYFYEYNGITKKFVVN